MTNPSKPDEVPIEIDRRPYKAPKPDMRGDELKALATIPADYQLFLDTPPGQGDDQLIPSDFVVHLKPGSREHFLKQLQRDWPEQVGRYQRLYAGRAYLPRDETRPVLVQIQRLKERVGIADRRERPVRPPPDPQQLALAI